MTRRTTVTVVSYNIRGGAAHSALAQVVAAMSPDVLVANEAPKLPLLWHRQCATLAEEWRLRRVAGGRDAGQNLLCGSDRVHVVESAARRLRQPRFAPIRGIVWAQCLADNAPFGVVGVHLSLVAERRPAEARAAIAVADRLRGPVVVCGDLNESPGQPAWRHFEAAGYADAAPRPEATFSSNDPRKRIDAVLVRGGRLVSYGVPPLPGNLYRQASDHLPVRAVLELKPNQRTRWYSGTSS